jgi:hypothetical protein
MATLRSTRYSKQVFTVFYVVKSRAESRGLRRIVICARDVRFGLRTDPKEL